MAATKQTIVLAVVVVGFWFADGSVAFPVSPGNPPAPPGPLPQHSTNINGGSSVFGLSFNSPQGEPIAKLNLLREEKRMVLEADDILGGVVSDNAFEPDRTGKFDLRLAFPNIETEVKNCVRNKNVEYPRFRFQEDVVYTGKEVTGTLRLDENATRAAGLTFVREDDEPELNEFELNIGGDNIRFFPETVNDFGFKFAEGQLFFFQQTQFVNKCSYEEYSYKDGDKNDVHTVPAPYVFARFCHDTFDLDVKVACRATDPRTGEIRETTGGVMSVVPEAFRKVEIDVIPAFAENHLVPSSELPLAVAILASKDFNPSLTVCDSVQVGKASAAFCLDGDANSDGLTDRVAVLKGARETGIVCGSTELDLTARTSTGEHILGTGLIETVLCRKESEIN